MLEMEKLAENSKFEAAKLKPRVMKEFLPGHTHSQWEIWEETRVFTLASYI